jgi:anion-transporting  ArsA/GET3 family ATPase
MPAAAPEYFRDAMLDDLLDSRLVFVTGKGGVGRSTVATALGLLAARRGRRTIVAELSGQRRAQNVFARTGQTFAETELAPNLFAISIDPEHAMAEYLRVKAGLLGAALGASRVFGVLAMATPGMRELLSVGKVWELAQPRRRTSGAEPYELVICDAPATGHGVGLLRTPRTFAQIARVGPVGQLAETIAATLSDPTFTRVLAVCTAEEMPVNEMIELERELHASGLALHGAIVNARYPDRFDDQEAAALRALLDDSLPPAAHGALRAALSAHARARAHALQCARLQAHLHAPLVALPQLFCEQVGRGELEQLADALEQLLSREPRERAGQPDDCQPSQRGSA